MDNLVNSLVIAVINPNYYGRKVFALFYIQGQKNNRLDVLPVWDMDAPGSVTGKINGDRNYINTLDVDDIWTFPTSVTEVQERYLKELKLDYRFHKDEKALERLASKLEMDKMNIGFDGEPEEGTWFNCCRINDYRYILPDNLYIYSLRSSDDDDSQPAAIEDRVFVNHFGDILTDKPLMVPIQLEVEHIEYDEEGNIIDR